MNEARASVYFFEVPATGEFWHSSPFSPDKAVGPYKTEVDARVGAAMIAGEIDLRGADAVRGGRLLPRLGLAECELGALADLGQGKAPP